MGLPCQQPFLITFGLHNFSGVRGILAGPNLTRFCEEPSMRAGGALASKNCPAGPLGNARLIGRITDKPPGKHPGRTLQKSTPGEPSRTNSLVFAVSIRMERSAGAARAAATYSRVAPSSIPAHQVRIVHPVFGELVHLREGF